MNTPILFLTFNRPDKTARVFDMIKEARPTKLYLASDGPREEKEDERDLVLETRKILSEIDWPCEVHKLYRDENLGCKKAVSEAITWFFNNEEAGIILEDDCLPDSTFFTYASLMLETYADDPRIMHINGSNLLPEELESSVTDSYYFSKNVHVWGWASWRRAWNLYNLEMEGIEDEHIQQRIKSQFTDSKVGNFWVSLFKHIKNKQVSTWDAQWAYAVLRAEGVCITPAKNLIENIGFGSSSTHTGKEDQFSRAAKERRSLDLADIKAPHMRSDALVYPIREDLDNAVSYMLYVRSFWQRALRKLKSFI